VPLEPGHTLLHYRIVDKLGEGGMGVVWRAVDTTLDREVAIKVLPAAFTADPERLARFDREAKLLASLNHPNIAGIYGAHEVDGTRFLAMELVEGEELAERLNRGPIPLAEAIELAREIASALEAAHDADVIHRDLKPANVKLTPDGRVKVLDFGLAKALAPEASGSETALANSPTLTSAGTVAGMILGTAAYMSPEQARGKPLDRRTDLWSFGCVLYEMLTGSPVFRGETATDVISAVISREPDSEALPQATPPALRRLLDRCLAKDARQRLRDAADARLELEDAAGELTGQIETPSPAQAPRRSALPWVVTAAALVIAAAAWVSRPTTGEGESTGTPTITAIEPLTTRAGGEYMPALSPDGRNLLFCARDGGDLDIFLVRVGGENEVNLTADHDGWDGAPEFSSDGERIAFASDRAGGGLFVMGATGESPRRVADEGTHPSWSPDGKRLVAATEQVDDPYSRSTRSRVFIVDLETGERRDLPVVEDGVGPRWSPDGRRIAYWSEIEGQRDLWTIAVDGGDPVKLTDDPPTDWEPLWAEGGRALYFHSDRGGSADLWRIPIDPETGGASGPPTRLTTGVMPIWESSISSDGSRLIGAMRDTSSALTTYPFDPEAGRVTGEAETTFEVSTKLNQPDLSPDGRMMAYRTMRPREIITTLELESGNRRRLIDEAARNRGPVWSPDGEWIMTYSNRSGLYQLWMIRPDGSDRHRVYENAASNPVWSPDGKEIVAAGSATGGNLRLDTIFLKRDPDATSGTAAWIKSRDPIEQFTVFDWSADGKLVGARDFTGREPMQVYDLDSETMLSIPGPRFMAFDPRWLPDGERVVYWDFDLNSAAIWNTRTGDRRPVPEISVRGSIMPSPDARLLHVLEHRVDGNVWMLTLDGDWATR
jgi:Tol biopolymer transport system component